MFAALKKLFGDEPRVRLDAKPAMPPEPAYGEPRPMTGFFASLTEDQKRQALAYRGPDWHGDSSSQR